jgi:hypothetical protein
MLSTPHSLRLLDRLRHRLRVDLAYFRRRGFEATLVALFYAMVAWIVMHIAIMIVSSNHPNYYDPA